MLKKESCDDHRHARDGCKKSEEVATKEEENATQIPPPQQITTLYFYNVYGRETGFEYQEWLFLRYSVKHAFCPTSELSTVS